MSIEENKAIVRRWSEELWGPGDLAVADEIVAADYVRHDPGDPFPARGPEDVKRLVGGLRAMLPDLEIEVEDVIAEGDKVVLRWTIRGTHLGAFWTPVGTAAATGKPFSLTSTVMYRLAEGRIVEEWACHDWLRVVQQFGAEVKLPGNQELSES